MSAVVEATKLEAMRMPAPQHGLAQRFELLASAPDGVARLRELILDLAVHGKLVPQDPDDEPADSLLARIRELKTGGLQGAKYRISATPEINSEPEEPYALPGGWAWTTLSVIGLINPRNEASNGLMASFVQMSSIPTALNESHTSEPRLWQDVKSGFTHFAEDDVGVAKITPCFENGKSTVFENLANGVGAGTTELYVVRPLGGVLPRYVLLFLKSPGFLRGGEAVMTGTAGQKRLPRWYVESVPVPLPPVAEQARIVARVDGLMRLCDSLEVKGRLEAEQHARLLDTMLGTLTDSTTAKKLTANWQRVAEHFDLLLDRPEAVDALERTILQLAVRGLLTPQRDSEECAPQLLARLRLDRDTWLSRNAQVDPECAAAQRKLAVIPAPDKPFPIPKNWSFARLLDCSRLVVDCHNKTAPYAVSGIPIIRTSNIRNGVFRMHELRFVTEETYRFWSRRCPPAAGDIIFTREAPMGEAAIVPEGAKYCLGQRTMLIRPMHEYILKEYLLLALTEPKLIQRASPAAVGATVKHLRVGDVERLVLPVPPLPEQHRIMRRVTELRRLCVDLRVRLSVRETKKSHLADTLLVSTSA